MYNLSQISKISETQFKKNQKKFLAIPSNAIFWLAWICAFETALYFVAPDEFIVERRLKSLERIKKAH